MSLRIGFEAALDVGYQLFDVVLLGRYGLRAQHGVVEHLPVGPQLRSPSSIAVVLH